MQYTRMKGDARPLWERYGEAIQAVLVSYLHRPAGEDGLLRGVPYAAAVLDGCRRGRCPATYSAAAPLVELNALWYAALRWVGETAPHEGLRWRWNLLAHKVLENFKPTFCCRKPGATSLTG